MNTQCKSNHGPWPLFLLLAAFYFLPYSVAAPTVKQQAEFFSIYHRFGGLISIWDGLLAFAFLILLVRGLVARQLRFALGRLASVWSLAAIMTLGFTIGLMHVEGMPLSYGTTEVKRAMIALLPAVYLCLMYLVMINYLKTREQAAQAARWLIMLSLLLIIYGVIRFCLIVMGEIATMRPFGLPIVLYDQMTMLYPFIFALPAMHFLARNGEHRGYELRWYHWILWGIAVLLILLSARRFNYLLLAAGLASVLLAGPLLKWWRVRQSWRVFLRAALTMTALLLLMQRLAPESIQGVGRAVRSLDMASEIGLQHGGNIRRAEIKNLFANMERRPYAYLIGMGLGTKWQEITEQPLDSFSYPKSYLTVSRGWFPQFHLPYLALLYRFGVFGSSALLICLVFYMRARVRDLQLTDAPEMRALGLGMLIFLALNLTNLGDSANPTAAILAGVCMGLLERLSFREVP